MIGTSSQTLEHILMSHSLVKDSFTTESPFSVVGGGFIDPKKVKLKLQFFSSLVVLYASPPSSSFPRRCDLS